MRRDLAAPKLRKIHPQHRTDYGEVLRPRRPVWQALPEHCFCSEVSGQVFQGRRWEHKQRFAWIRAGKITEEQFAAWHKTARDRKKDCGREAISPDEFKAWLKDS